MMSLRPCQILLGMVEEPDYGVIAASRARQVASRNLTERLMLPE